MTHTDGTRESVGALVSGRGPGTVHLMRYFAFSHLPPFLSDVSRPACDLAAQMCAALPDSPELEAGLRKLLEAKDCFVRAALDGRTTT